MGRFNDRAVRSDQGATKGETGRWVPNEGDLPRERTQLSHQLEVTHVPPTTVIAQVGPQGLTSLSRA